MSDNKTKQVEVIVIQNNNQSSDLKTWNMITYALYAFGMFMGGLPWVIAVIMNYVKLEESKGTIYESHARWQISMFWASLIFGIIGALTTFILVGFVILAILWVWILYRVIRGFTALSAGNPV